ncbi:MAG: gliding motility lipoprotein GldH [Muribaculaceae bacterium]|nr:gliding motility lipoprotein GldH [Muribaculaceae bacterium]
MNKIVNRISALAAGAALLASCGITGSRGNGDDNYFSAFVTFPHQQWEYAAPAQLTVDTLRDSVARGGTLMLSVRHTDAYEYSNLWLELAYPDTDSTVCRDTINLVLADVYGRWRGHGSGPSVQITDTIASGFTLHRGDTLTLRHIMRVDTLPNIEQVGLVFYP